MLNYIWISLIAVAILAAAGNDVRDELNNTYRNGVPLTAHIRLERGRPLQREGELVLSADAFNAFYGVSSATGEIRQPIILITPANGESRIVLSVGDSSPGVWREMARGIGTNDRLSGRVISLTFSEDENTGLVQFDIEPIHFVKMRAITLAAFDIAGIAVNIALGLIGIMALWLGVMKVAEEAGLLKVLTRALTPITRRLFPDVPPDHPAIGAMIMNIAANMLGLSNAATPLGLKAMEELNKLSPKVGTATNAMVTFLALNTGGLVLIPATAIAVRASIGSVNPGIIIGTSFVGASCATIAGVAASKLLQRLPRYRKEMPVLPLSDAGVRNV
jgi:spore maturation protein A